MTSGTGRRHTVPRERTEVVKVVAVRLVFVTRTTIRFVDADRQSLAPLFVPYRARRVCEVLEALGWPLEAERLGFFGRRPEKPE